MDKISSALKALGHPERLRILVLLSHGELTVSELTQILSLSQPRVTQYIKTLENAGIIERMKEGSWVFSRLRRGNEALTTIVASTLAAVPTNNKDIASDLRRLDEVQAARAVAAQDFFAKVANDRDQLSAEYLPRGDIEEHMRDLAGAGPFDFMVDLGTGTGRILEVFSDCIKRGAGIDSNHDMLKVARHNLNSPNLRHLSVRQGDLHSTPLAEGISDFVTLHQVLHYLDKPSEAIREAARLLRSDGQILIVDFDSHDREEFRDKYAHRRLGFSDMEIADWMSEFDLSLTQTRLVKMPDNRPAVKLWLGTPLNNYGAQNVG